MVAAREDQAVLVAHRHAVPVAHCQAVPVAHYQADLSQDCQVGHFQVHQAYWTSKTSFILLTTKSNSCELINNPKPCKMNKRLGINPIHVTRVVTDTCP